MFCKYFSLHETGLLISFKFGTAIKHFVVYLCLNFRDVWASHEIIISLKSLATSYSCSKVIFTGIIKVEMAKLEATISKELEEVNSYTYLNTLANDMSPLVE